MVENVLTIDNWDRMIIDEQSRRLRNDMLESVASQTFQRIISSENVTEIEFPLSEGDDTDIFEILNIAMYVFPEGTDPFFILHPRTLTYIRRDSLYLPYNQFKLLSDPNKIEIHGLETLVTNTMNPEYIFLMTSKSANQYGVIYPEEVVRIKLPGDLVSMDSIF